MAMRSMQPAAVAQAAAKSIWSTVQKVPAAGRKRQREENVGQSVSCLKGVCECRHPSYSHSHGKEVNAAGSSSTGSCQVDLVHNAKGA
jgi:hypothetical protein